MTTETLRSLIRPIMKSHTGNAQFTPRPWSVRHGTSCQRTDGEAEQTRYGDTGTTTAIRLAHCRFLLWRIRVELRGSRGAWSRDASSPQRPFAHKHGIQSGHHFLPDHVHDLLHLGGPAHRSVRESPDVFS